MIYAVLWQDFIPLSLLCHHAEDAIARAKAIGAKARANDITLRHLRAVSLSESNELVTLWEEEAQA